MTDQEIAQRFPPPLGRWKYNEDGIKVPILEKPFIECGHRVHIRGKLVVCIRRKGHPLTVNYGHSNGYDEWLFDEGKGE